MQWLCNFLITKYFGILLDTFISYFKTQGLFVELLNILNTKTIQNSHILEIYLHYFSVCTWLRNPIAYSP